MKKFLRKIPAFHDWTFYTSILIGAFSIGGLAFELHYIADSLDKVSAKQDSQAQIIYMLVEQSKSNSEQNKILGEKFDHYMERR